MLSLCLGLITHHSQLITLFLYYIQFTGMECYRRQPVDTSPFDIYHSNMGKKCWLLGLVALALSACLDGRSMAAIDQLAASTAPTAKGTCADLDAHWGDWPAAIDILNRLIASKQSCGAEPLARKLYAAHFNYAAALEAAGDTPNAIQHYLAAFRLDPRRDEALVALARLNALPAPTAVPCTSNAAPNSDPAPAGKPNQAAFVTVQGDQLVLKGQLFQIKGVNYYPRHAPWHRFLEQASLSEISAELDLIKKAGFNTLRVFLRYDTLFTCAPEAAIPNKKGFTRVDAIFRMARTRGFKLIVTLNDLPDLHFRPLYTDWARYDAQTTYIVRRYRGSPVILAWDLRNEGDLDWGADGRAPVATQEQVMRWLARTSQLVRANDPYHLLTAGWWGDPTQTAPYVDILSFHHWTEAADLAARIDAYRATGGGKPLLLEEVGYHSWTRAPLGAQTLDAQADILGRVITVAEEKKLAGWLVWTAFDFSPLPGQPENHEHFFGLWTLNLKPKPALDALPLP